jgi:hypothetical protein
VSKLLGEQKLYNGSGGFNGVKDDERSECQILFSKYLHLLQSFLLFFFYVLNLFCIMKLKETLTHL